MRVRAEIVIAALILIALAPVPSLTSAEPAECPSSDPCLILECGDAYGSPTRECTNDDFPNGLPVCLPEALDSNCNFPFVNQCKLDAPNYVVFTIDDWLCHVLNGDFDLGPVAYYNTCGPNDGPPDIDPGQNDFTACEDKSLVIEP